VCACLAAPEPIGKAASRLNDRADIEHTLERHLIAFAANGDGRGSRTRVLSHGRLIADRASQFAKPLSVNIDP
jgi:hypothetical protein